MKRITVFLLLLAAGFLTTSNLVAQVAAPNSLAGLAIIVKATAPKIETEVLSFAETTFMQSKPKPGYGLYTYDLNDASHAVLTMTQQQPGDRFGDVTTLALTFKNNNSGSITGLVAFAGGGSKRIKAAFTFDVTKPAVRITSPKPAQKWSNTVVTATGKASDNIGVTAVRVQINNGGWVSAETSDGYTNWTVMNLPVVFGLNKLQACSVDARGNISATNTVTFFGILAPASLSGYAARVRPPGSRHALQVTWGDDTWGQVGLGGDPNPDDYCAGSYTYTVTGSNTATLASMDIGMLSWLGTTNVTTVNLTITDINAGTLSWSDGSDEGSAAVRFSRVSNLVPASLAGRKVQIYVGTTLITTMSFNDDGTFTKKNGGDNLFGSYTFTQYSPTVAIIRLDHTDPDQFGATEFIELTFTSATGGRGFGSYYEEPVFGSNPSDMGQGTFKLR